MNYWYSGHPKPRAMNIYTQDIDGYATAYPALGRGEILRRLGEFIAKAEAQRPNSPTHARRLLAIQMKDADSMVQRTARPFRGKAQADHPFGNREDYGEIDALSGGETALKRRVTRGTT